MGTCNAGHGCSITCSGGCGCVYSHSSGKCTCKCFGKKAPDTSDEIPKLRPDELVDISMTEITIREAIDHLQKFID